MSNDFTINCIYYFITKLRSKYQTRTMKLYNRVMYLIYGCPLIWEMNIRRFSRCPAILLNTSFVYCFKRSETNR